MEHTTMMAPLPVVQHQAASQWLRTTGLAWDGETPMGWSESGLERWATVLALPLPPLPRIDARVDRNGTTWRVCLLDAQGVPVALVQPRVRRDALAPWRWLPLGEVATPHVWALAHQTGLAAVAQAWQGLDGDTRRRANANGAMAAVLRGPAWALLSGRAGVGALWSEQDLPD